MSRGAVIPCVISPSGHPISFHRGVDPRWGEVLIDRVTPEDASCFIVTVPGFGTQVEAR